MRWLSGASRLGERQAGELAALVAEQRLGAAVDRDDPAVAVDQHDAVGRGVEDGAQLAALRPRRAAARLRKSLAVASPAPAPVSISTSADSPFHGEVNSRALTGTWSPLLVAMVSDFAPLLSPASSSAARRTARRGRRPLPARRARRSRSSRGRRGWRRSACRAGRPGRRPAGGRGSAAGRRPHFVAGAAAVGAAARWAREPAVAAARGLRSAGVRLHRVGGAGLCGCRAGAR